MKILYQEVKLLYNHDKIGKLVVGDLNAVYIFYWIQSSSR